MRNSQLQRLLSRPFSTRFGRFLDERSSLGTVSKRGCLFQNARARNTHVEATLNHPCPALGPATRYSENAPSSDSASRTSRRVGAPSSKSARHRAACRGATRRSASAARSASRLAGGARVAPGARRAPPGRGPLAEARARAGDDRPELVRDARIPALRRAARPRRSDRGSPGARAGAARREPVVGERRARAVEEHLRAPRGGRRRGARPRGGAGAGRARPTRRRRGAGRATPRT